MVTPPNTNELYTSHIPALQVLVSMGYEYLTPEQTMALRSGKTSELLLRDVLIKQLQQRRFDYKGRSYPLSPNAIDQIVREISAIEMNEGLALANERIYDKLTYGITVTEFIDGKKHQPTIPVIDWSNVKKNNVFHVTDEFEVLKTQGTGHRRPDVVCFVNGIPLVIIEAKKPVGTDPDKDMIKEGISQHIRNQKPDEIPHLFAYSQLLFSIKGTDGRYGTTKTQMKFWAAWHEEEIGEPKFEAIKNKKLTDKQWQGLFAHREPWVQAYFKEQLQKPLMVTDQDRLLISLLMPERLLEYMRYFILFDTRFGKIAARYQQVFGVKRMLQQVNNINPRGERQGGVIWHTTGSGKSFSMVFLSKALILHDSLKECRIILVTDRKDLQRQLSKTFMASGAFGSELATSKEGEKSRARSGKDLAKRIGKGDERIIFSIVNKFATAAKQAECHNPSPNIIVLVDEDHRSHGGETHQRMKTALPNAAYIAFTGTPLLKGDKKKTTDKFGPIIHTYTMQRAEKDKVVTPLLYEERIPELDLNEKAIDNWFDKITAGLSDSQKADLKKKFASKGTIYKSANRIELIAWDISTHFKNHIKDKMPGMKGQLATDSKISAIRYQQYLEDIGEVTSAVVISAPDTREDHEDVDAKTLPVIQQWWKDHVGTQKEEDYTAGIIESFGTDEGPDILIVVSKLLTGFDEPRNTVLYIDKPLKHHELMQAIARVNRLHEKKKWGLLIDYRGILKELDTAIQEYRDLAEQTQAGFDIDDIEGLYHQISTEYKRLPALHDQLWVLFKGVANKYDFEQVRHVLVPIYATDDQGRSYDTNQKVRDDFYRALTEFGMCLKVALSSSGFFEDRSFTEKEIAMYKNDLRYFNDLRTTARRDAQETVDYSEYEKQLNLLADKQVIGVGIKEPEGMYIVNELGEKDPKTWSDEKTRNETDIIKTRIRKTIEQQLEDDPYAQKVFSALLKEAIADAEAQFEHPYKQYVLYKDLEERLKQRAIENIPDRFDDNKHARAYYGLFRLMLGDDAFAAMDEAEHDRYIDQSIGIDEIVYNAVAENSLNPNNIEAEIRKALLPQMYKQLGMDKAKEFIEQIIHIMRVGLSKDQD